MRAQKDDLLRFQIPDQRLNRPIHGICRQSASFWIFGYRKSPGTMARSGALILTVSRQPIYGRLVNGRLCGRRGGISGSGSASMPSSSISASRLERFSLP